MVLLTKRFLPYQGLRGERGKDGRPGEVVRLCLPSVIFGFCSDSLFTATKTRIVVEEIHQTRLTVFYRFSIREES